MTGPSNTAPAYSITNLTAAEQRLLRRVPDEEHRSVLYREILRDNNIEGPHDLSVAENVLVYDYLHEHDAFRPPLTAEDIRYLNPYGTTALLRHMAARLGETFGVPVSENDVFGTAGVASALQSIVLGLQQPRSAEDHDPVPVPAGSTVLLPAPFWQGFYWSFEQTAKLKCVPIDLTSKGLETFQLTLEDLQSTYDATQPTPKLLVLTNPHNPLGVNYDVSLLEAIYEWVLRETNMHIISDEMYCHSQLPDATPAFVSALKLQATTYAPDRVHVAWGFAKDFGLSGFRAGFLISKSEYVHSAMKGDGDRRKTLSWFTPFDSLKHHYIESIVCGKDDIWNGALAFYKGELKKSFDAVADVLNGNDIRFVHPTNANSAQFFWLDLPEFLEGSHTFDAEKSLQDGLWAAGVKLLSGHSLTCKVPGYFRLCFTADTRDAVVEAVQVMCAYLKQLKKKV